MQHHYRTILAGDSFSFKLRQSSGVEIFGSYSKIEGRNKHEYTALLGCTMAGQGSTVYGYNAGTASTVDFDLRGVQCFGDGCDLWGEEAWNHFFEIVDVSESEVEKDTIKDTGKSTVTIQWKNGNPTSEGNFVIDELRAECRSVFPRGVVAVGMQSTILARPSKSQSINSNTGVILAGNESIVAAPINVGVIIGGCVADKSLYYFKDNGQGDRITGNGNGGDNTAKRRYSFVSGPGIYIRGCETLIDNHYDKSGNLTMGRGHALIQLSDVKYLPVELKGYLQLMSDCTIKDADGKEIIKNGKLVTTS